MGLLSPMLEISQRSAGGERKTPPPKRWRNSNEVSFAWAHVLFELGARNVSVFSDQTPGPRPRLSMASYRRAWLQRWT